MSDNCFIISLLAAPGWRFYLALARQSSFKYDLSALTYYLRYLSRLTRRLKMKISFSLLGLSAASHFRAGSLQVTRHSESFSDIFSIDLQPLLEKWK